MSTLTVEVLDIAERELEKFPEPVIEKFLVIAETITKNNGFKSLPRSKSKKLSGPKIYEARVKHDTRIYRALGGFVNEVLLFAVFFEKKSQKVPVKEINKAQRRIQLFKILKGNKS